jgi:formamidopyrimidine-DNA glycosylase
VPELPDVELYREALDARVLGRKLRNVTLKSPVRAAHGGAAARRAVRPHRHIVDRIGKRIAFGFDGDYFLVVHLMIAGRLQWKPEGGKAPAKITLALFDFDNGELALTEAGTRKRASLHVVQGREALARSIRADSTS